MKPKTKFQKRVVELSQKVKPISGKQEKWAEEKCFDRYYVRVRNRNNCLECGHKWKPDGSYVHHSLLKPTCPNCGAKKLKHIDNWNTDKRYYAYYAKIEVVEEMQLVRMFRVEKYMKRKQPAQFTHIEAMQHFIEDSGHSESLQRLGQGMGSVYIDSWVYGSKLELRTKSWNYHNRNQIVPNKILPGREVLPVIKRNGYRGYFYGEAPNLFFETILKSQEAETLLKSGQIPLFKNYVGLNRGLYHKIHKHWSSVKIAIRNGYKVERSNDWLDYLDLLEEFGKDLHNAHYVCPPNFHKAHQKYVTKRHRKWDEEHKRIQMLKLAESESEYQKVKGKYCDIRFDSGDIKIKVLSSVKDVVELGKTLHHCLDLKYAMKEQSLIMGAFSNDQALEAIEIDLNSMKIIQARGLQNKPSEYHNEIVEAVEQNLNQIRKRKRYKEVG